MAKENMREALLQQMNKSSNMTCGSNEKSVQQVIAKDTASVKRAKKVTMFTWSLLLIYLLVVAVIEVVPWSHPDWFTPAAILVFQALIMIAVICSVSLYIRSRTLTLHKIQARLANIEEQLKKMSQDK